MESSRRSPKSKRIEQGDFDLVLFANCFELAFTHPETVSRDAYLTMCDAEWPPSRVQMHVLRHAIEETCDLDEDAAQVWSELWKRYRIPFNPTKRVKKVLSRIV